MHVCSSLYQDVYLKSKGYIPLWPFNSTAELGDLFLIRKGNMIRIGNINIPFFGVSKEIEYSEDLKTDDYMWQLDKGVGMTIKSRGPICEINGFVFPAEKQGMLLQFDCSGSYFFKGSDVITRSIDNFHHFQFKLLQQLASEKFNFTELYVVHSVADVSSFAMAIASADQASMMVSSSDQVSVPYTLDSLADESQGWKLENMQGVDHLHLAQKGGTMFFKAHKLATSHKGKERILKYMREMLPKEMHQYMGNILNYSPTQILPSEEIFPANVHELFHFREVNLDDVALLFGNE